MHVVPEDKQRPFRQHGGTDLEPDEAVRERCVGGDTLVHGRTAEEIRGLTLVQQDVAR